MPPKNSPSVPVSTSEEGGLQSTGWKHECRILLYSFLACGPTAKGTSSPWDCLVGGWSGWWVTGTQTVPWSILETAGCLESQFWESIWAPLWLQHSQEVFGGGGPLLRVHWLIVTCDNMPKWHFEGGLCSWAGVDVGVSSISWLAPPHSFLFLPIRYSLCPHTSCFYIIPFYRLLRRVL